MIKHMAQSMLIQVRIILLSLLQQELFHSRKFMRIFKLVSDRWRFQERPEKAHESSRMI